MARRPASRKKAKAAPAKRKARKASLQASLQASPQSKAAAKSGQWVYTFGGGKAQGRSGMKDLLGGKGANLAEMANLGLPVPPGFTITTAVCTHYYANDKKYPKDLEKQVDAGLAHIAKITGRKFGDAKNPLLVSVRSGARASMPGMMDTVLNLGPQRRHGAGAGQAVRRPALRLRFLSPLHPDVFQRGARHRAPQLRGHSRGPQVARSATRSTPS